MKHPRVAPLAGLVVAAMMLAACGGGGGGSSRNTQSNSGNTGNTGNPGNTGGPAIVGDFGVPNSVALVKGAMAGANEAASADAAGVANGFATAASVPGNARALGGYGQVFSAIDNTATNTRIQVRNLETYVRSAGKWRRVQFSDKLRATTYAPGQTDDTKCSFITACLRAEPDGGISFKPEAGRFVRFWPEAAFTQSLVTPAQVEAIFSTAQTRLVKDNRSGEDDRAKARYLVNVGAAWALAGWEDVIYEFGVYPAYNTLIDAGHGRLTLVKPDFNSANFHSGTDAQADELANPVADGGRAPLANSQNVRNDDDVVKIVIIGDSATQGHIGPNRQDSFRRHLWNSLMTDPTLPMVDFVGTRSGTSTSFTEADAQTFCARNRAGADGGGNRLREFDPDHEGYWSACIDHVVTQLGPALSRLDGDTLHAEPDVALIHLGTHNLNTHGEAGINPAIEQLKAVIAELRKANENISIFVAKIIPFKTQTGAASPLVATFNAAIETQIAPMTNPQSKVVVVDHSAFPVSQLRDRFQPNDAGEKTMADTWMAALKANDVLVDKN